MSRPSVADLVRASMGTSVSNTVTDDDLDRHVAELILKEAKQKAERYGKEGFRAYISPDGGDSNAPKANKRFLSSIIRNTDDHNKTILKAQALAAQEIKREREEQERRERKARAEEAVDAERMRRLMGGAHRRGTEGWERDGKRKERSWREEDRERDRSSKRRRHHHRSRSRSADRSRRRDDDRRSRQAEGSSTSSSTRKRDRTLSPSRQRSDAEDVEDSHTHERRRHRRHRSREHPSSRRRRHSSRSRSPRRSRSPTDASRSRSPRRRGHSPTDAKDSSRTRHRHRRTPSASPSDHEADSARRRKLKGKTRADPLDDVEDMRSRSLTPDSTLVKQTSASRALHRSPSPPSPAPHLPSKMDKYFEASYDPRLDVAPLTAPKVPSSGLIDNAEFEGWDAMLELIRIRREDKEEKKRMERLGLTKEKVKDKKTAVGQENVSGRWGSDSVSIMDIEYKKKGSVREWDMGKDGF